MQPLQDPQEKERKKEMEARMKSATLVYTD